MSPEIDERNFIDVRLFKIMGLHQLLSPVGPKSCGLNAFGWAAVACVMYLVASISALIVSVIQSVHDVNACIQYVFEIIACTLAVLNLYWLIRYSGAIWTCVQTTRVDSLSYGQHRAQILESGRTRLRFLSTTLGATMLACVLGWVLLPFVLWGQFTEIRFSEQETRRYRTNVMNFVLPISAETYDKYFAVFYLGESVMIIICGHAMLAFDVLVVSLCFALLYQLKTVADSFAEFSIAREHSNDGESLL